jgi:hypothetical protein
LLLLSVSHGLVSIVQFAAESGCVSRQAGASIGQLLPLSVSHGLVIGAKTSQFHLGLAADVGYF